MRLMLAPMEGVVDHTMRELLTSLGGIDRCVTEFVRVSDALLPARVFRRYCPELAHGGGSLSPDFTVLHSEAPGVLRRREIALDGLFQSGLHQEPSVELDEQKTFLIHTEGVDLEATVLETVQLFKL